MVYPVHIVSNPIYAQHLTGPGQLECPDRYTFAVNALEKAGLLKNANHIPPKMATRDDLHLCHTAQYCRTVFKECLKADLLGNTTLSTGDVKICRKSYITALMAVGGAMSGVDAVMSGEAKRVFCVLRPPGHHACSSEGMGFCLFNNVALAARYAQKHWGAQRVAIIDWDVHHGNGTQEIFEQDGSVLYISTHLRGIYPGTGKKDEMGTGDGIGATLNIPVSSRSELFKAFTGDIPKKLARFKPDLIIISAGFDGHIKDPLGGFLGLSEEDFATLTDFVVNWANLYAEGRIVSVLEGGYDLEALAASVVAHVRALGMKA